MVTLGLVEDGKDLVTAWKNLPEISCDWLASSNPQQMALMSTASPREI